MTASFVHGEMINPEKKKIQLEMLMQAKILALSVPTMSTASKNYMYVQFDDEAKVGVSCSDCIARLVFSPDFPFS